MTPLPETRLARQDEKSREPYSGRAAVGLPFRGFRKVFTQRTYCHIKGSIEPAGVENPVDIPPKGTQNRLSTEEFRAPETWVQNFNYFIFNV
jgi:hypothetical protein